MVYFFVKPKKGNRTLHWLYLYRLTLEDKSINWYTCQYRGDRQGTNQARAEMALAPLTVHLCVFFNFSLFLRIKTLKTQLLCSLLVRHSGTSPQVGGIQRCSSKLGGKVEHEITQLLSFLQGVSQGKDLSAPALLHILPQPSIFLNSATLREGKTRYFLGLQEGTFPDSVSSPVPCQSLGLRIKYIPKGLRELSLRTTFLVVGYCF